MAQLKKSDAFRDLKSLAFLFVFILIEIVLVSWALFAGGGAEAETNILIFLISTNLGIFGLAFIFIAKLIAFFVKISKAEKSTGWINSIIHDPETSDIPVNKKGFRWIKNPFIFIIVSIIATSILGTIQVFQNTFLTAPTRVPQQITETAQGILSTIPADMEIWIPVALAAILISVFKWMEKYKKIDRGTSLVLIYIVVPVAYALLWMGLHKFHHGASTPSLQFVLIFGLISAYMLVIFRSVIPVLIFKIMNNLYDHLNGIIQANETILFITIGINFVMIIILVLIFTLRKPAKATA